jgi:hypothetical protein
MPGNQPLELSAIHPSYFWGDVMRGLLTLSKEIAGKDISLPATLNS